MSLRGASCFWRASAAAAGERGVAGAGNRHSDGVVMRTSIPVCVGSSRFLSWILGLTCATLAKRSEEHTSELQSHLNLVCRLLLEKKNPNTTSGSLISSFHSLVSHVRS